MIRNLIGPNKRYIEAKLETMLHLHFEEQKSCVQGDSVLERQVEKCVQDQKKNQEAINLS